MILRYFPFLLLIGSFAAFITPHHAEKIVFSSAGKTRDISGAQAKLRKLNLGSSENYINFRAVQIFYATTIFITLFVVMTFMQLPPLFNMILPVIAAFLVVIYVENRLNKRVLDREKILESEFPYVLEMLTLSITAGDSPAVALDRFTKRAKGVLAIEFSIVVGDLRDGKSLTQALDDFARRNESKLIQRFANSLIIAMNRGTPLFEVLNAQAREARNMQRSAIIAMAGKAELSMMVPIVFLILPISILFALFPSLSSLSNFL